MQLLKSITLWLTGFASITTLLFPGCPGLAAARNEFPIRHGHVVHMWEPLKAGCAASLKHPRLWPPCKVVGMKLSIPQPATQAAPHMSISTLSGMLPCPYHVHVGCPRVVLPTTSTCDHQTKTLTPQLAQCYGKPPNHPVK